MKKIKRKIKKFLKFCEIESGKIKNFLFTNYIFVKKYFISKKNFILHKSNLNDPSQFLKSNFKLIPDKPLDSKSEEKIRFGHERIANVITDIFIKTDPPFTLGLFGGWGVGKSTIINKIEENLINTKIRTVIFDVWKYDDDSLRRQLLIKLDENLNLKNNFKETLNQSLSIPYRLSLKHNLILAVSTTLYSLPIFLLFLILWLIFKFNIFGWSSIFQVKQWLIDSFSKVAIYGILISFISNLIQSLIRPGSTTIQKSATDSSEGFEDCFNEKIIGKLKKDEKLLIIIDNLDRTTSEKSLALLSDVKTFLSKDNDKTPVYFLIACDDKAVREQIRKSGFSDPDEYLRKFFNASISIPKYLGEELDEYTIDQLKQSKISAFTKNTDLVGLITFSFRNNPREIKQFVNTLVVNYLLAKEMEDKKDISQHGAITKKIESLAKILIIKQKYPDEYKELENQVISNSLEWENVNNKPSILFSDDDKKPTFVKNREIDFSRFVEKTKYIEIPNISIFIRLKQSEQEKEFPNLSLFFSNAEDGDETLSKKILSKMNILNFNNFDIALKNELQRLDYSRVFYFINLVFIMITSFTEKMSKLTNSNRQIAISFPSVTYIRRFFNKLDPVLIFKYIFENLNNQSLKKKIVKEYSLCLDNDDREGHTPLNDNDSIKLIKTICKYSDYFLDEELDVVIKLSENYFKAIHIQTLIENNGHVFISNNLTEKYITSLDIQNLNESDLRSNLFCLNNLNINSDMPIKNGFEKYSGIIQVETGISTTDTIKKEIILSKLFEYSQKFINKLDFVNESDPKLIDIITSQLNQWFNGLSEDKNKYEIIKIYKNFNISSNSQPNTIVTITNKFWTEVGDIFTLTIPKEERIFFLEKYHDAVINGIKNNIKLFDLWFKDLSDEDVESIVIFNLDRGYQVDTLGNRWDKISPRIKQVDQVKNKILDTIDSFNDVLKKKMILYCENNNFFYDPNNKNKLLNYLLRLGSIDNQSKLFDFFRRRRYFDKQQRAELGL